MNLENFNQNHASDIPMQQGACHEFVENMSDWKIVKEYEEKGVSGFKVSAKNRDAIIDLQEAALNKEFDVLLVSWILGTHDENPQNQSFETIDFTAFFAFLLEKCLVMCYN